MACFGLVSAVACVLLVVAIYDMDEEGKEDCLLYTSDAADE